MPSKGRPVIYYPHPCPPFYSADTQTKGKGSRGLFKLLYMLAPTTGRDNYRTARQN